MPRKILVWGLLVVAIALGFFCFGPPLTRDGSPGSQEVEPTGRWLPAPNRPAARRPSESIADTDELARQLETLGYVSGSQPAPGAGGGVTVYDRTWAFEGLNLYASGHGPEAILMDMEGRVLHSWRFDIEEAWPKLQLPPREHQVDQFYRRVHLFENGDLLAIFDGLGMVKIDRDSKLLWSYGGMPHHDVFVTPDEQIYVLTRKATIHPRYDAERPLLVDAITVLDRQGREQRSVSILECIENSGYSAILEDMDRWGDAMHTNTLEVLDGRLDSRSIAFRRGNVLVSIRFLDFVGVIDLDQRKVVWGLSDMWRDQHQPTVLDGGNLLVFDNRGLGEESRVLELDPFTQQILWEYRGTEAAPFYTSDIGSSQRLPNGNTLITESNSGRAFEVTRDKRIVWEFVSPHRAGEENELIATLMEMLRLPPDFPTSWLEARGKVESGE